MEYKNIVSDILRQHVEGTAIFLHGEIATALVSNFQDQCNELEAFLTMLSIGQALNPQAGVAGRGPSPEAEDRVLSVGEKLSARFLAALLEDKHIPAEYIDLSEIIKPEDSHCSNEELSRILSEVIGPRINACGRKVPVGT